MFSPRLPPLNFYRLHLAYFVVTSIFASAIFYASNGERRVSYTDSLFLCVSAMTISGLNTVNLSILTTWQQFILFSLMAIGSGVFISAITVFIRLYYFGIKFKDVAKQLQLETNLVPLEDEGNVPRSGATSHDRNAHIDKFMIRVVSAELQSSDVGFNLDVSGSAGVQEIATLHSP
jgi:Trk-type K+ transport system membrane component